MKKDIAVYSSSYNSICVECRLSYQVVFFTLAVGRLGQCLRDNWEKLGLQSRGQEENKMHLK